MNLVRIIIKRLIVSKGKFYKFKSIDIVMINKKGEILALKIIGAATGATGFVVLGVSSNVYANMLGTALIGIGSLLIVGGSN